MEKLMRTIKFLIGPVVSIALIVLITATSAYIHVVPSPTSILFIAAIVAAYYSGPFSAAICLVLLAGYSEFYFHYFIKDRKEVGFRVFNITAPYTIGTALILYLKDKTNRLLGRIKERDTDWMGFITKQINSIDKSVENICQLISKESHLIMWASNTTGMVDWISEEYRRFTGITPEYMKLNPGDWWHIVVHPDDLAKTIVEWSEAARSATVINTTFRFRKYDGTYVMATSKGIAIEDGFKATVKWFGVITLLDATAA
jgi:PAS domain-containing protein